LGMARHCTSIRGAKILINSSPDAVSVENKVTSMDDASRDFGFVGLEHLHWDF
jgi:hypothetical protein